MDMDLVKVLTVSAIFLSMDLVIAMVMEIFKKCDLGGNG
jgi:hypothetical protein